MIGIIINIVLAVLLIGSVLYIFSMKAQYKDLEEDYFDFVDKQHELTKQLEQLQKENDSLQKENARLNQAPKAEKISKPRKTAPRKTAKK